MPDIFGWNSLETVSTIQSTARIIGITLLGLLVMAETIDFIYDRREHTLAEIADRAAETSRQHEQHEAEARHSAEVAELREQATQAEQTLRRLQKDREPRILTSEQQTELTNSMRTFQGQKFTTMAVMNDDEGKALRDQIAASLVAAGWDHDGPNGMRQSVFTVSPVGIQVTISKADLDVGRQLTAVQPLIDTLASFGLLQKGIGWFVSENAPPARWTLSLAENHLPRNVT
jgi:hypothetical protein